jgi:hypothetical protein
MKTTKLMRAAATLALSTAALLGCGGGAGYSEGIAPFLVALIRAEFSATTLSLPAGASSTVRLTVRCDRDELNYPFGRLRVGVRLDPDGLLPAGIQATVAQAPHTVIDGIDYHRCIADTLDPAVKQRELDVTLTAATDVAPGSYVLQALLQLEPERAGEPSRDSTLAELNLSIPVGPPTYGRNLLVNGDFSAPVGIGPLPAASGAWVGDLATVLPAERGISPRSAPGMLSFIYTGTSPTASALQSSQKWQLVDVRELATDIAAGRVRADGSVWFNRVLGDEATDRRFDLRLIAFDGEASTVPARYSTAAWLAVQATSVLTVGNQWEQAQASLVLPPGTTFVLVEIYAFEDVVNEVTGVEFSGHYADDTSLVLTLQ